MSRLQVWGWLARCWPGRVDVVYTFAIVTAATGSVVASETFPSTSRGLDRALARITRLVPGPLRRLRREPPTQRGLLTHRASVTLITYDHVLPRRITPFRHRGAYFGYSGPPGLARPAR